MNELKRCYLTAVISEDGTKVEQVCVSRYRYPLPTDRYAKPKLKQVNGKLKPRQPWETMGCSLTDTAIFDSIRKKQNLEQILQAKKELDKVKFNAREQAKMMRWYDRRKEGWE